MASLHLATSFLEAVPGFEPTTLQSLDAREKTTTIPLPINCDVYNWSHQKLGCIWESK